MEKINVAELLKDCPQGMELDCTIFDNVTFDCVADGGIWIKRIDSKDGEHSLYVYNDGSFPIHNLGSLRTKCVIFPKGKTTWEGFVPPCKFKVGDWIVFNGLTLYIKEIVKGFYRTISKGDGIANSYDWGIDNAARLWTIEDAKDGDVLAFNDETIVIFKDLYNKTSFHSYCHIEDGIFTISKEDMPDWWEGGEFYPAIKEQRELLFQKIKEAGYKWNAETKTPEKLIEPKFKVGNWYQCTKDFFGKGVTFDKNTAYYCAKEGCLQDEYGSHIAIVKDLYDNFKLWTIEDAKEGDVLAINWYKGDDYWEKIIIFKKYHNGDVTVEGYGNTFRNGELVLNEEVPYFSKTWTVSLHPATKEQRELLFQKIKESGYKWNTETKTPEKLPIEKSEIENNIVDIVKENDNRFRIVLNHQFDMEVDEGEYYVVRRPQLSSIWHDINEEPIYVNGVTPIIIDSNYGHISCEGHHYNEIGWKNHIESQRYREFKWAYENDLMSL